MHSPSLSTTAQVISCPGLYPLSSSLPSLSNTRIHSLHSPTSSVLVGDKLFHLYTTLLSKSSGFLANALKPVWRTDTAAPIDLSDEDPAVFQGYVDWLYTRRVVGSGDEDAIFMYLAQLFVLGEKLMATMFQNSIMTASMGHAIKHKI